MDEGTIRIILIIVLILIIIGLIFGAIKAPDIWGSIKSLMSVRDLALAPAIVVVLLLSKAIGIIQILEILIIFGICFGIRVWGASANCGGFKMSVGINEGALLGSGGLLLGMAASALPLTSIPMLIGKDLGPVTTVISKVMTGLYFVVINKLLDFSNKANKNASCEDPAMGTIMVNIIIYAVIYGNHLIKNVVSGFTANST